MDDVAMIAMGGNLPNGTWQPLERALWQRALEGSETVWQSKRRKERRHDASQLVLELGDVEAAETKLHHLYNDWLLVALPLPVKQ